MKITRRQFVQVMAVAGASALLTACGGSSNSTAGSGAASAAGGSFNLKLGHNLAEDHAVHIQLTSFAEQVKEKDQRQHQHPDHPQRHPGQRG